MSRDVCELDALDAIEQIAVPAEGEGANLAKLLARVRSKSFDCAGCWVWDGLLSNNASLPEMQITRDGFRLTSYVRRLLLQDIAAGPMRKGWVSIVECEQRLCVNPEHLRAGSKKQSSAAAGKRGAFSGIDKVAKMMQTKRANSRFSEATMAVVRAARTAKEAAEATGMSLSYAKAIRTGQFRRDLSNPFARGLGAR